LFVRDTVANTTKCVSLAASGTATGNAGSAGVDSPTGLITDDGRYALFHVFALLPESAICLNG
jgi:hypothetical protein